MHVTNLDPTYKNVLILPCVELAITRSWAALTRNHCHYALTFALASVRDYYAYGNSLSIYSANEKYDCFATTMVTKTVLENVYDGVFQWV